MTPQDFLYHEAALLDQRRFDEWLALYSDDATYWIPQGEDQDPAHHVSLVYDDRRRLRERVLRLASGFAHSQDPPSRTCHLIGNIRAEGARDGEAHVVSNLVLAEVRRDGQNLYAGQVEHDLVPNEDAFLIRRKVVRLVNSDVPLGNMAFLI